MSASRFQVLNLVAKYTGTHAPPKHIINIIISDMTKKAKKKSEFKGTFIRAIKLYKNINKHKGTEKAIDLICEADGWLILVIAWYISKQLNTSKVMEDLDENKENMSNEHYLNMCEHLKVAHTIAEVCCINCLNEEFDYRADDEDD